MQGMTFAPIVASFRGRNGKTWVARLLAEHFVLAGQPPLVFDTDAVEGTLSACFPQAMLVDLDRVTDQIRFFDALAAPSAASRVVDVTHRSFAKFFKLLEDSDLVAEARRNGVEPVIFYVTGREHDSHEQGRQLLERFDCPLVIVDNAFLGEPTPFTQRSPGFQALGAHPLRLALGRLDPGAARLLDDPDTSLSQYLREPAHNTQQTGLREWLTKAFREVWLLLRAIEENKGSPPGGAKS